MRPIPLALAALPLLILGAGTASAHSGGLDANGCHYEADARNYHCHREVPPNPDRNAPVKKSRENVCHDRKSPNYKAIKYFVRYAKMDACLKSGGVRINGGN